MIKTFHKSTSNYFALLISILLLIACKKEEIKGPQGDPGINGTGGNSSISSTKLFYIDSLEWTHNLTNQEWQAISTQTLISQAVNDKGVVKLYSQIDGLWKELPYAVGDEITQFGYALNQIKLFRGSSHGDVPGRPEKAIYRLVVFYENEK